MHQCKRELSNPKGQANLVRQSAPCHRQGFRGGNVLGTEDGSALRDRIFESGKRWQAVG